MGTEIERKFLLKDDSWRKEVTDSFPILQAYGLVKGREHRSLRIRITGEKAFLTLKGPVQEDLSRMEFEYSIPPDDARILIREFCEGPCIEKTRHIIPCPEGKWEIDEFAGDNAGLILAELELPAADTPFTRPHWLGREVSGNKAYYNSNLRKNPYTKWDEAQKGENV